MSGSYPDWSNPFCTRFVRPGVIPYRFPDGKCNLESFWDTLQASRRGLIVGPHGSGKSTLIHALMPALCERYRHVRWIQICDPRSGTRSGNRVDRKRHAIQCGPAIADQWRVLGPSDLGPSDLGPSDLLVIDGLEQVPLLNRLRMLLTMNRRTPTLLATSHRKFLPMPTLFQTEMNYRLAGQLTTSLIGDASEPMSNLVANMLTEYDWEQSANLRDFWFECYDQLQGMQLQSMAQPGRLPPNRRRDQIGTET